MLADDDKPLQLTQKQLTERLARQRAKVLKDLGGTDDEATIKVKLAKLADLEKQDEDRKRASLTREQQLEQDLKKERALRSAAQVQLRESKQQRLRERQTAIVRSAALDHVSPLYLDEATTSFREHLRSLKAEEVRALGQKDIGKWFQAYVKRKPAFAKPSDRAAVRREAVSGAPPEEQERPEAVPVVSAVGRTPRPNQPNSMTKQEWEAEKKRRGISY